MIKHTAGMIATLIGSHKYIYDNETQLQDGIEIVLRQNRCEFNREVILNPFDRLDFLARGGIAIEVKIKGARHAVVRQLLRYAQCSEVGALILVTTKANHLRMPERLNDKPLRVCSLLDGAFC